jgi:hypothetical protein
MQKIPEEMWQDDRKRLEDFMNISDRVFIGSRCCLRAG